MPDWSYQTVFQRVLFRFPAVQARNLALFGIGTIGRLPMGKYVIDYMGHMVPDAKLRIAANGMKFPSAIGLACGIDPNLQAFESFGQFGFGFIEIGPVSIQPPEAGTVDRDASAEWIELFDPEPGVSLESAMSRLPVISTDVSERSFQRPMRMVRLAATNANAGADEIIQALRDRVDAFVLPADTKIQDSLLEKFGEAEQDDNGPALVFFLPLATTTQLADVTVRLSKHPACGVFVDGTREETRRTLSPAALCTAIALTMAVREATTANVLVIATGGVHEPGDALRLKQAGAQLVGLDSGFVFTGPGLPKRVNEAILATLPSDPQTVENHTTRNQTVERQMTEPQTSESQEPQASRLSWFWAMLMGVAMFVGGVTAIVMAVTRVILPYDERFLGITRFELLRINDRLIDFMKHDRVTLAGTMLSVGILYCGLAWYGVRRGQHWAQQAIIYSAFVGFFTFFFFLGFGYFDPFHAFITTILFQFLLFTIYARLPRKQPRQTLDLWNDDKWKISQWGQLLYIVHGAILIVAGAVISRVGMTSVFVPEDMDFLCTTADNLLNANPQLIPLVAHDRATFGGMLIATGIVVHLAGLWGFRRGERWLWWTLLIAGLIPYLATIWVHADVGYTSFKHLLPAYGGLIGLIAGAVLSHGFLCDTKGHTL